MNNYIVNNCPFCKMVTGKLNYVSVQEDKDILAIMDLYPATPGHILIFPKKHIENIYNMPAELGAHIMAKAVIISKVVKNTLSPDGLNLIQSNELEAGQTIPHFHLHIVPRYRNDAVILRFGHGDIAEKVQELRKLAGIVSSELEQR